MTGRLPRTARAGCLPAVLAVLLFATQAVGQDTIRPGETDADLLCVTDAWAVWRTAELDERTRVWRAPIFTHRFYRQRLSERDALLVHTERNTSNSPKATVTAEGTVVVWRGHLSWYPADGPSFTEPRRVPVADLFSDGAVLHETTGLEPQPVYYLPFKQNRLDPTAQVELRPAGARRLGTGSPVVRHGNLLAWIVIDAPAGRRSAPDAGWDAALHTYDLKSAKRDAVKLDRGLHESYRATAMDGEAVMAFSYIFDRASGKCLNAVAYPDRPSHLHRVFATRNRIGYYVRGDALYATDLLSAESPSLKLAPAAEPLCATSDDGLIVWNGTRWQTVPWLSAWPAKAE